MKGLKKILPMMLSVMLLVAALPANAEAKTYEENAGSEVTVQIPVTKGFGGEGKVVFSNEDLFSSIKIGGSNVGSFQENEYKIAFSSSDEITEGAIDVTVTIKDSAQAGDSCKISVSEYEYVDADDNMVASALESQTVTVVEVSESTESEDEEPSTDDEQQPQQPADNVDYSELERLIQIAEGLDSSKYTDDSWAALAEALQGLYDAKGCGNQATVDAACQAFNAAYSALVEMDYSKLEEAIAAGNATIDSDNLASLIAELVELLLEGEDLLSSNNQAAVDAKADEIVSVIDKITAILGADDDAEAEPSDEVEPTDEYCNIPIHKVWPILFFISLAVNILLVVLYVSRQKKYEKELDDQPMVDYQISDDDK